MGPQLTAQRLCGRVPHRRLRSRVQHKVAIGKQLGFVRHDSRPWLFTKFRFFNEPGDVFTRSRALTKESATP